MRFPPYVKLRGSVFWYRRRVPDQLVPLIGRAEIMETLGTRDIQTARTKAALRNAEIEELFVTKRLELQRLAGVVLQTVPTDDEQEYIREAVRAHVLRQDEAVRLSRPLDDTFDVYVDLRSDEYEEAREGLRTGRIGFGAVAKERISQLLAAVGVQVQLGTVAWDMAALRATEGLHQALKDIGQRSRGEHVRTPRGPVLPVSLAAPADTPSVIPLGHVIDHYLKGLAENDFRRKVVRCLQLFGAMIGRDTPVAELRQKAVTDFIRDICRLPVKWAARFDKGESIVELLADEAEKVMSPSTYEANYRGPLGTFLSAAARDFGDDGFRPLTVERLVYTGDRVADENQQRALEPDELVTLFEGEEFQKIAGDPKQESLYWFLVVMLFTGARPREVCQINPQVDFGQLEGHWYIDLSDKTAPGVGVVKSIKTGQARRLPVHEELVRLGFPEYLQRMKDANVDRLFPSWRVKQGNPYTAHYKLTADLLRATDLYTRSASPGEQVTGAYTLRKTFITQCRNQSVVSRGITGHSDGSTTPIQDKSYIFGPEPFHKKRGEMSKLVMPVRVP